MFLKTRCPSCQARLKITEERIGTRVRCPSCGHRFIGEPDASSSISQYSPEPAPLPPSIRPFEATSAPLPALTQAATPRVAALEATNVSVLTTGLVGAMMTIVFYMLVVIPLGDTVVGRLFSRGWVSLAILLLTCWSIAMIVMKFWKLRDQKNALLYDLLPQDLGDRFDPETAGIFMEHIGSLPLPSERSFLVNRILRGLQHFRFRRNTQEVASLLDSQSELDAMAVEASYTMLRSFIWAVPILGFIGTVVGIGDAVGSFSASVEGAANIDEIKGALGGVTGGLGTAFDTTLIALVMSIILMIPMSWLHKQEEDLLSSIGGYSNEELLMRLDLGIQDRTGVAVPQGPPGADGEAFLKWTGKLEEFGEQLSKNIGAGWERADAQLRKAGQDWAESVKSTGDRVVENAHRGWDDVRAALEEEARRRGEQMKALEGFVAAVNTMESVPVAKLDEALKVLGELGSGIADWLPVRLEQQLEAISQIADQYGELEKNLRESAQAVSGSLPLKETLETVARGTEKLGTSVECLDSTLSELNDSLAELRGRRGWLSRKSKRAPKAGADPQGKE